MDNRFEGVLVNIEEKSEKCVLLILKANARNNKTGKVEKMPFTFKCLGETKAIEAKQIFENYKNCLLKVVYILLPDEKTISNAGNEYWKEGGKMVVNMESAGKEPEHAKEEPTIEREPSEPTDEEDDTLPF